MVKIFHTVSQACSRAVTEHYSTSFSSAIKMLHRDLRAPIYNIYGFVRLADEIVDSFHEHNKPELLEQFRRETFSAIDRGISLNPVLNSFQLTVRQFSIDLHLVESFFQSMEKDLTAHSYDEEAYREYIYGSAEVVGLMCLIVFCEGDRKKFEALQSPARSLGAAFQKINFLRDFRADFTGLSRIYFPGCDFNNFCGRQKKEIEADIRLDLDHAMKGILRLPLKARFGVYVAYKYYYSLFNKICKMKPESVLVQRIRIPNYHKALIFLRAGLKSQLNLI